MQLHLFGANTACGEALRQILPTVQPAWTLVRYSRHPEADRGTHHADFRDARGFQPAGTPGAPSFWISFGPIWLFVPFLEHLALHDPARLQGIRAVVACASSSVRTKRYAANRDDQQLVARLNEAESRLLMLCRDLGVACCILQPTLIYGRVGLFQDRNLSRLLAWMRRLPLLPVPASSGLRQPIHARQLAAVALRIAERFADPDSGSTVPERLPLGGDQQLSYQQMLAALQAAQPPSDPARRCRLLPIPNRLFWLMSAPLLLRSPRTFEAILRMGADLAGMPPSHQLLDRPAEPFPLI